MSNIDREIQTKRTEVEVLAKMLDNAKRDLKNLENIKKEQEKKDV